MVYDLSALWPFFVVFVLVAAVGVALSVAVLAQAVSASTRARTVRSAHVREERRELVATH